MSVWSKGALCVAILSMVGGCTSAVKQENESLKAQNATLQKEVGLARDHARQAAMERDIYREKGQAKDSELLATKKALDATERSARSSQSQIEMMSRMGTRQGGERTVQAPGGEGGKYHLRIISLPSSPSSEKVAKDIADYLTKKGVTDVHARTSGKFWVVDIGHFPSSKSPQAVELRNSIRGLKYKGVPQFKDAYYVPY